MKNRITFLGTYSRWLYAIALAAVIGFGMAACDNGNSSDDSGNTEGGIDPAIVARWYDNQGAADTEIPNLYPFALLADGTYTYKGSVGQIVAATQTYTASGGKLALSNGDTADYTISGTTLTLSNASGTILKNGVYYKKAQ